MCHRFAQAVALVVSLFVATAACADTVYLKDESIVHGAITQLTDSDLFVTTKFAGDIVINMTTVRGMTTDNPLTITLNNGNEVAGRLAYTPGHRQHIAAPALKITSIDIARITALRPVDTADPAVVAQQALPARQQTNLWTSEVRLGVGGSSGNSESHNWSLGAKAKREAANDRLYLRLLVNKAAQDGEETTDDIVGTVRLEHDYSADFFVYGQTELESAQFENIDLRSTTTVGPGYFFIREEDQQLKGRFGLGYEHIVHDTGADRSELVFSLGYDYFVGVFDWLKFSNSLTYIPQLSNDPGDNYRIESIFGLAAPLGSDSGWSALAEYHIEYNNNPAPDVEQLDTTYQLTLVRSFE